MNLGEFLQDNSGGFSANRLNFLVWGLGSFAVWATCCIVTRMMQPIPESVLVMVGIVSGAKAIQRFGEKSVEITPSEGRVTTSP